MGTTGASVSSASPDGSSETVGEGGVERSALGSQNGCSVERSAGAISS